MAEKRTEQGSGQSDWGPGARFLVVLGGAVVVIAGLRAGKPILLPSAVALFLASLAVPIMLWLQRRHVPAPIAILLAVLVEVAIFGGIILIASQSVADFQGRLPSYVERFQVLLDEWIAALQARGLPAAEYFSGEFFSSENVMAFVQGALSQVATFVSNTFLVFLILVFMLAEASIFPKKFRAVFDEGEHDLGRFSKITSEVLDYLAIKTMVSLATGLCIGLWAWVMGLDFPIILGLVGFLLNYVPTIGSIIAAVPAVLLALLQGSGPGATVLVMLGYVVINVIFGNLLEPNLQGRRLGLSTLVVILSLMFWAWAWGPVGALLAVPLTMVVKIMLENTEDLRWVAVLLDRQAPAQPSSRPTRIDRDEEV
jgi:predicted PurR-regulated permease PerM